jgi:hypothetical protein
MSRVAILTTAVGYTTEQVSPLWNSLARVGFDGKLVLLVDTETADAIEKDTLAFVQLLVFEKHTPQIYLSAAPEEIQALGRTGLLLDSPEFLRQAFSIHPVWTDHFIASFNHPSVFRYLFFRAYLDENADQFDAVITCDCRDVVFQADPGKVLNANTPLTFGYEVATMSLGSEAFNTAWVQHLWGEDFFNAHRGNRIVCSGATIGNVNAMRDYIKMMNDEILALAHRTKAGYGFDQAIHNRLWWDKKLPGLVMTENFHAEVANLFGEAEENVMKHCRDGVLLRADTGTPVMLVHQHDRYPDLGLKAAQ